MTGYAATRGGFAPNRYKATVFQPVYTPENQTELKSVMQSKGVFADDKVYVKIIKAARDAKIKEILDGMKTPENAELFADGQIEKDIKEFQKISDREIFKNTKLYDFLKGVGKAVTSGLGLLSGLLGNAASVIIDLIKSNPSKTSDFQFKADKEVDKKLDFQITKLKVFVENVSKLVKECESGLVNATPEQITAFVNEKMEEYMQLAEAAAEISRKKGKETTNKSADSEESYRTGTAEQELTIGITRKNNEERRELNEENPNVREML